jgi:dTDP-4-amino-4,6-dideoxy-D-glucose/dTDP-4-amino-2,4-dideoxy-beta-L-xylose transaminase
MTTPRGPRCEHPSDVRGHQLADPRQRHADPLVDVDPATFEHRPRRPRPEDLTDHAGHRCGALDGLPGRPAPAARRARRLGAVHGVRPMVVEDCAYAWGPTYDGVPLGRHGNLSVFSFQAIKHLTCGSGGPMVLPDEELYRREAAALVRYGPRRRPSARRLRRPRVGLPVPDERDLRSDPAWPTSAWSTRGSSGTARTRLYDRELKDVPGLEQTERAEDRESSFWMYPLTVRSMIGSSS